MLALLGSRAPRVCKGRKVLKVIPELKGQLDLRARRGCKAFLGKTALRARRAFKASRAIQGFKVCRESKVSRALLVDCSVLLRFLLPPEP